MNIIELVRSVLTEYPRMDEFSGGVHIDFTEADYCGLMPISDQKVSEDILGNQIRQSNFVLYADGFSINDYSRLQNSTFLLELGYYLESIEEKEVTATINNVVYDGKLNEIVASNGMAYEIPTGDVNDGIRYQLQIYATYKLKGR